MRVDLTTRDESIARVALRSRELEFEFDHLLLTLGSETNFFNMDGVRDWSVTMKSLSDTALLTQSHGGAFRRSLSAER